MKAKGLVAVLLVMLGCGCESLEIIDDEVISNNAPHSFVQEEENEENLNMISLKTIYPKVIWASEIDVMRIQVAPDAGEVLISSQLKNAMCKYSDDAIIGITVKTSNKYDERYDTTLYNDKTIDVYKKNVYDTRIAYEGVMNYLVKRDNCTEEDAMEKNEFKSAYSLWLEAMDEYRDADTYCRYICSDFIRERFTNYGFNITYDLSSEQMKDYLYSNGFLFAFTTTISDFKIFIDDLEETNEAYTFCLAMPPQELIGD